MRRRAKVFLLFWLIGAIGLNTVFAEETESNVDDASTHYVELHPAFVTNYSDNGRILYLKVDITLRVTTAGKELLEHHMPLIRHELIMLLSGQDSQTVSSAEGKNQIRLAALDAVQQALEEEAPGDHIDDLLFTAFVVQR